MKWFKNLTIGAKLLWSLGILCGFLIGLSWIAYRTFVETQRVEREEVDQNNRIAMVSGEIRTHQIYIRAEMFQLLTVQNPSEQATLQNGIEKRMEKIDQGFEKIKNYWVSKKDLVGLEFLDNAKKEIDAYREGRSEQFRFISSGKLEEARVLATGVQHKLFEQVQMKMQKISEDLAKDSEKSVAKSIHLFDRAVRLFFGITLGAVFFAALTVLVMHRLIVLPLRSVTRVAEQVAKGDLSIQIEVEDRTDEIGTLQGTLKIMLEHLRGLNRELREGIGLLAASSSEMLTTASQVAESTSQTAISVNETGTTAEEVKQTAYLSHQKAKSMQENSSKTASVAETGRNAVLHTLEGMNHIRERMESIATSVVRLSEQGQVISEIIATVNDLAEQSNLLAVNAALEASRAGDYGKEFAVVAQEVKSLAEQSRQATTQVRVILMEVQRATSAAVMATEQGTKAVAAGVKQATTAGESIQTLADSIAETAQAALQITASSQQQLTGMDQISLAVGNIRQATQQNTASAQQLKGAAKNLQEFGLRLRAIAERQRLEMG